MTEHQHRNTWGAPDGGWDAWKIRAATKAATDSVRPAPSCYIGGPMRGHPEFNFPAFDSLAAYLRAKGWRVVNPAEHDREVIGRGRLETAPGYAEGDTTTWATDTGFSFSDAMRWDIEQVLLADAIVLLPGWQNSTGARYERMVAEATDKDIYLAAKLGGGLWLVILDPCQSRTSVVVADSYE